MRACNLNILNVAMHLFLGLLLVNCSKRPWERIGATCELLGSKIYILGGISKNDQLVKICTIDDFSSETGGSLLEPRWRHASVKLDENRILITGGYGSSRKIELYSVLKKESEYFGQLMYSHFDHNAVIVSPGKILIFGGGGINVGETELYDLTTKTSCVPRNTVKWGYSRACMFGNGKTLIVGISCGAKPRAQIYDPKENAFFDMRVSESIQDGFTLHMIDQSNAIILGGRHSVGISRFNVSNSKFETIFVSQMSVRRSPLIYSKGWTITIIGGEELGTSYSIEKIDLSCEKMISKTLINQRIWTNSWIELDGKLFVLQNGIENPIIL